MVTFVHLTPEERVGGILQKGIACLRAQDDHPEGIFAMPFARSFYVSHQWLGELRQRGHIQVAALHFRVPDDETVWVGHYRRSHQRMTAADAIKRFRREKRPEGFEVIIPRVIRPGEIHRIHHLARVLPWRYAPGLRQESRLRERTKSAA
jgi:hypothetical protein